MAWRQVPERSTNELRSPSHALRYTWFELQQFYKGRRSPQTTNRTIRRFQGLGKPGELEVQEGRHRGLLGEVQGDEENRPLMANLVCHAHHSVAILAQETPQFSSIGTLAR